MINLKDKSLFILGSLILCGVGAFKFPFWIADGTLHTTTIEDTLGMIGVFIAAYGGFIGSIFYLLKRHKKNK